MKYEKRGFSLIELMVAVFLISSCLLLIIGIFTFLFNSASKATDLTAGTAAGELVMEQYIYQNYDTIKTNTTGIITNQLKTINGVVFRCDINISAPVNNCLRKVDTTVYWWITPSGDAYTPRTYQVKNADGSMSNVTTGAGYVAEYGSVKTTLTKFVIIPTE